MISLIVAMAENRVIGQGQQIPWHLPADLQHFKQLTMGKPIIMGRKTYESIGKALPGRINIIVTRRKGYRATGCCVVASVDEALARCRNFPEVMIIGGAELYRQTLPHADRIYLTLIHQHIDGDVFFPAIDEKQWRQSQRVDHEIDKTYRHSFIVLDRREPSSRPPPAA